MKITLLFLLPLLGIGLGIALTIQPPDLVGIFYDPFPTDLEAVGLSATKPAIGNQSIQSSGSSPSQEDMGRSAARLKDHISALKMRRWHSTIFDLLLRGFGSIFAWLGAVLFNEPGKSAARWIWLRLGVHWDELENRPKSAKRKRAA